MQGGTIERNLIQINNSIKYPKNTDDDQQLIVNPMKGDTILNPEG
jgi:hypothetical protein